MKIDILSLFPEMFKGPLTQSIVGKAIEKQLLDVEVTDFRDYTTNKQRHVDAVFSKRRLVQPAFARARLDYRLPPQISLEVDEPLARQRVAGRQQDRQTVVA